MPQRRRIRFCSLLFEKMLWIVARTCSVGLLSRRADRRLFHAPGP